MFCHAYIEYFNRLICIYCLLRERKKIICLIYKFVSEFKWKTFLAKSINKWIKV